MVGHVVSIIWLTIRKHRGLELALFIERIAMALKDICCYSSHR